MDDFAGKGWLSEEKDSWANITWPTRVLQMIVVVMFVMFWLSLDTIVPIILGH